MVGAERVGRTRGLHVGEYGSASVSVIAVG